VRTFVLSCQQEDGGFKQRPDTPFESDPELTAYAILGLAGIDGHSERLHQAEVYLHSAQQEDGTFVSATPIEIQEPEKN
jgi:prenyltransferase beta subunit